MMMVLLPLTPVSFALLFASTFFSQSHASICPHGTTPKHKAYELQVTLDNHATFCSINEKEETSRILGELLDQAFLDEIFIKSSQTFVCPNPAKGRRILAAEGNTTTFRDDPKTRKLSLWGRYIYRGGARCLHCNPDHWDARRRLGCDQRDKFLPIEGIISTDNWNGELLREVFRIPKYFSKAVIFFQVVIPGGDTQLKSFTFFNSYHNLSQTINVTDLFEQEYKQIRTGMTEEMSWAYKIINRNSETGYINVKFALHLSQNLFATNGKLIFKLLGEKEGGMRGAKVKDIHLIARKFCMRGDLEQRISERLTDAFKKHDSKPHCLKGKSPTAVVDLVEIDGMEEIEPC